MSVSSSGPWVPSLGFVFRVLLVARLLSAFFMHISDCDEVYNFWEPLHYVMYGSGQQTWEYSPVYALRSYAYILLHAAPMVLTVANNKLVVFTLVRVVLALVCTMCEFYFYRAMNVGGACGLLLLGYVFKQLEKLTRFLGRSRAVLSKYGGRVARLLLIFLVFGCGMYISSTAFLPSSFSMYLTMMGMGAWFNHNHELAIFSIAVSSLVGWPFAGILGVPIALSIILKRGVLFFLLMSAFCFIIVSVPLVLVDSIFYGKFTFATANIILYNVFSASGGSQLYGVEPFSYYIVNGFLNFNVVFFLAVIAVPVVEAKIWCDAYTQSSVKGQTMLQRFYICLLAYSGSKSNLRSRDFGSASQGLIIFLLVFGTRPHKEERFLFPIYPLLCLNAAICLTVIPDLILSLLRLLRLNRWLQSTSRGALSWLATLTSIVYVLLSLSRILALYFGYHAPLDTFRHLSTADVMNVVQPVPDEVNLCLGKEWYRYPSEFFLPDQKWRLRFLESDFKGQLPQPFGNNSYDIPENMNDMNREEPSRYFRVEDCHFLIDLDLPSTANDEFDYAHKPEMWTLVAAYPFLDASSSHQFFRAFYIPKLSSSHTVYRKYVILLNKLKFNKLISKLTPNYNTHSM